MIRSNTSVAFLLLTQNDVETVCLRKLIEFAICGGLRLPDQKDVGTNRSKTVKGK